ncbi:methyl-accepting chemotaxis protein [Paenibacillus amylolyticus]|uniref:Methyl-accepting chemotaxis protein n=1 Tax=Paenibacillus amylolyticus TaxID=1451 RepID=A0AAP5H104_PAEAM|nr:methyl-accepting chemotaxis protein [Paenibacillus amylolyticus]MDR6723325.1 methyl-accepting chemotaxis protein [Paenibacillus amylolyticus]
MVQKSLHSESKRRGIKHLRLTTTLILMLAVSLVGLFILFLSGIFGMNEVKEGQGKLYTDRFLHQTNILEIKADFYNMRANYTKLLDKQEYTDKQYEQVQKNKSNVMAGMDEFSARSLDPTEQEIFTDLQAKLEVYDQDIERIMDVKKTTGTYDDEERNRINKSSTVIVETITKLSTYIEEESAKLYDAAQETIREKAVLLSIVLISSFAILGAVSFITIRNIILRMRAINHYCAEVTQGNLTATLDPNILQGNNEISVIARGIHSMTGATSTVITSVVQESRQINEMSDLTNQNMSELNERIREVSATVEELSATMEETSAYTENMNQSVNEVLRATEYISSRTKEEAESANVTSDKAEALKQEASESSKAAQDMYTSASAKMNEALERANAVDQISVLSQSILDITAQTNLLALNASIEAARAGEAGRGFAVVAEEIRKLADGSRVAADQIRHVTSEVTESVAHLSSSAKEMLAFMYNQVGSDYQLLENTAGQYYNNAVDQANTVNDLHKTAQEVNQTVDTLVRAIHEIATASEQSAASSQHIAEHMVSSTEQSLQVADQSDQVKESASRLNDLVKGFKV